MAAWQLAVSLARFSSILLFICRDWRVKLL